MTDNLYTSLPIYSQIADRITRQIIRGELKPGEKLPSVREMAIQSKVNPNTVQRTYRELEIMEIVESRRGQGTFVTENREVLTKMREKLKQEEISQFVRGMQEMGYSDKEILSGLEVFLQSGKGEE